MTQRTDATRLNATKMWAGAELRHLGIATHRPLDEPMDKTTDELIIWYASAVIKALRAKGGRR